MKREPAAVPAWLDVCALSDLPADAGVAALVDDQQVALFRLGDTDLVFALGNHDPFSGANVLSRGIVGDVDDALCVASPVYKQHFGLADGICLEDESVRVPCWPVRIRKGRVELQVGDAVECAA